MWCRVGKKIKDNIIALILATILSEFVKYNANIDIGEWGKICTLMLVYLCIKEVLKSE